MHKYILIIASYVFTLQPLMAQEQHYDNFNDANSAYQKAIKTDDPQLVINTAKHAFNLGEIKFGENINTANLAVNYANALAEQAYVSHEQQQQVSDLRLALYQQALTLFEQYNGQQHLSLIDPLIGLAATEATQKKSKKAKRHLLQAVDIAQHHNQPLLEADLYLEIFEQLKQPKYISKAYAIHQTSLPENSLARLKSTFYMAKYEQAKNAPEQAITLYKQVIEQLQVLDFSHPYLLASHAALVKLYQDEDQSDQATAHCIAIGKMSPWSDEQEQTALYRVPPKYPLAYAKRSKEGSVQLSFTVTEQGFVKDPKVISVKGGDSFIKPSLAALKNWRYAPKFENGKAVAAQSTVQLDYRINK